MTRRLYWLLTALLLLAISADGQAPGGKLAVSIRGRQQDLYVRATTAKVPAGRILFAPGDGGWRGFAITVADIMSSWGYEVYGFDTKRYLESFTTSGSHLQPPEVMADMRAVAGSIRGGGDKVIFVGWSEGAGLGVLAGVPEEGKKLFRGIVAIGLPASVALGWRWADYLTYVTKKEPDEPAFFTGDYLPKIAPLPFLMIHSLGDEYTAPDRAKNLFEAANSPKRLFMVQAQNHRFDGNRDEFFRELREGLEWILQASR